MNVCMERVARLRSRWLLRANGRVTVNIGQSSNSRGVLLPNMTSILLIIWVFCQLFDHFANYLSILLKQQGCSFSIWDEYFANYFCQLALPPDQQPIRREIIRHAFSREQLERGGKLSRQSAIIQLLLDELHPASRLCTLYTVHCIASSSQTMYSFSIWQGCCNQGSERFWDQNSTDWR